MKAEAPSCPMCRGPLFFRGFRQLDWKEEKKNKDDEGFGTLVGEVLEWAQKEAKDDPMYGPFVFWESMMYLADAESTYRVLKSWGYDHETIVEAIEDGVVFSIREKWVYYNDFQEKKTSRKQIMRGNRRVVSMGRA